jgi:hypothetical protein
MILIRLFLAINQHGISCVNNVDLPEPGGSFITTNSRSPDSTLRNTSYAARSCHGEDRRPKNRNRKNEKSSKDRCASTDNGDATTHPPTDTTPKTAAASKPPQDGSPRSNRYAEDTLKRARRAACSTPKPPLRASKYLPHRSTSPLRTHTTLQDTNHASNIVGMGGVGGLGMPPVKHSARRN